MNVVTADICPRTPRGEPGVRPLSRIPTLHTFQRALLIRATKYASRATKYYAGENADGLFAAVSLPRVSLHVLKLKTVASLGKDYAIPANAKLPPRAPDPVTHFSFQSHYAALREPAVINEF